MTLHRQCFNDRCDLLHLEHAEVGSELHYVT